LFSKKENLVHEIILLNVVDSLLHHVTHVETTKMHGTIFVQHFKKACWQKNGDYIKRFTILKWRKKPWCKLILTSFEWL
jgi:hypothetical protein